MSDVSKNAKVIILISLGVIITLGLMVMAFCLLFQPEEAVAPVINADAAVNTNANANINASTGCSACQAKKTANTNTTPDTSDWLTYDDPSGLFSISYPPNITAPSPVGSSGQVLFGNGFLGMAFSITTDDNPDNLGIDEYITNGGLLGVGAEDSWTEVVIDNVSARSYQEGNTYRFYVLPIDEKIITIWSQSKKLESGDEFDDIFKTFKLTTDTSDWLTYENEEYKFSLKYPADWSLKPGEEIDNWDPVIGITSPETQQSIDDTVERLGYCEGCGPDLQIYFFDSFNSLLGNNYNNFTATTLEDLVEEDPTKELLGTRAVNNLTGLEVQEGGFGIYYALYFELDTGGIFQVFINNFDLHNYQLTADEDAIIETLEFN